MRPQQYPLYSLTVVGSLIGVLLSVEGVYARIYGQFILSVRADPWWHAVLQAVSAPGLSDLHQAGWLPVVVGTAWFGALAGLWLNHRWGWHAVLALGALSALHGGGFTALGMLSLALALTNPVRRRSGASPNP